jgi:ApbE superfamily uncharacterized protein (UPF0280 family)
MYEKRVYRDTVKASDLVSFSVVVKETDLFVLAEKDLSEKTLELVLKHRRQLELYIQGHPDFLKSLAPVKAVPGAPETASLMAWAASEAGVGPMAAVAGAFAEITGNALLADSAQVIVENGGDIFIKTGKDRIVAVYAGDSPLSGKMGIRIKPADTPIGVCTSSGKVGPSLSLGVAHAACVISKSAALADAAATAVGNAVKAEGDVERALEVAQSIRGVLGAVVVSGDKLGAWGQVELVKL